MEINIDTTVAPIKKSFAIVFARSCINFVKKLYHTFKTATPKQRPRLFSALWFFVCGWIAIEVYAIDPDMSIWNVIGYSLVASLIYAFLGACFGVSILQMPKDETQLFKAGITGALCGLFFTLIILFLVPLYLVLSHALPMPSTQQTQQLLWLYGVVVPFAFVCLPAVIVGIITTVLLRVFHLRLQKKETEPVEAE